MALILLTTRMHSSRMRTARSLLDGSLDRTPPLDRDYPPDRDSTSTETETPPLDRQTSVKTLPSQTSFAGGIYSQAAKAINVGDTKAHRSIITPVSTCSCNHNEQTLLRICSQNHNESYLPITPFPFFPSKDSPEYAKPFPCLVFRERNLVPWMEVLLKDYE